MLENLPPGAGTLVTEFVFNMNSDGFLDVVVEDDTMIDFMTLPTCVCTVPTEESTWGNIKALYED